MNDDYMSTSRAQLDIERKRVGDSTAVVAVSPDEAALDVEFDNGYGHAQGPHVLVWTESRVYFPMTYDGAEWLGSAPRNPQLDGQEHQGGE